MNQKYNWIIKMVGGMEDGSNQIVTFNAPQLTQASFLQKIKCCKMFFDICNAEMAQSLSSLQKLIILIIHVKKLNN